MKVVSTDTPVRRADVAHQFPSADCATGAARWTTSQDVSTHTSTGFPARLAILTVIRAGDRAPEARVVILTLGYGGSAAAQSDARRPAISGELQALECGGERWRYPIQNAKFS